MTVNIRDLVRFSLSRQAISWAVQTSTQKIMQTDKGFVRRGLAQILQNTFQGDLAKNAFREWLEGQGIVNIWEYDRIRPHFRSYNPKGYQLKVTKKNGREVTIDVNSSVVQRTNQFIIKNRDIKVTAGSRDGKLRDPMNLKSEVYVQIYVKPQIEPQLIGDKAARKKLFAEETRATRHILQISRAYTGNILTGFAWATRQDVERFRQQFVAIGAPTTWSYWKSSRIWWKCPIKKSRPLNQIIRYLR